MIDKWKKQHYNEGLHEIESLGFLQFLWPHTKYAQFAHLCECLNSLQAQQFHAHFLCWNKVRALGFFQSQSQGKFQFLWKCYCHCDFHTTRTVKRNTFAKSRDFFPICVPEKKYSEAVDWLEGSLTLATIDWTTSPRPPPLSMYTVARILEQIHLS